jgi:hypothetical protein
MKIYPKCANTFRQWVKSRPQYVKIYSELGSPKPFDVSLRDGIQALTKEQQETYTLNYKKKLYDSIVTRYEPQEIEIGSLVNDKVLPVFKDTIDFYYLVNEENNKDIIVDHGTPSSNESPKKNNYILIPNRDKLQLVLNNTIMNHFSFITSASNSFQLKNTRMTVRQMDDEMSSMLYLLEDNPFRKYPPLIKVYLSCINECPIEGKIDNDYIVHRILMLQKLNISNICLSDTCGTLEPDDFEYIIDTCKIFGIRMSQISLHLHVKKGEEARVEELIQMALARKITVFDVSVLETGGCSVTMNKSQLASNLSYDLYYKALANYIEKCADKQ